MYSKIINPATKRKVSIYSKIGIQILYKYLYGGGKSPYEYASPKKKEAIKKFREQLIVEQNESESILNFALFVFNNSENNPNLAKQNFFHFIDNKLRFNQNYGKSEYGNYDWPIPQCFRFMLMSNRPSVERLIEMLMDDIDYSLKVSLNQEEANLKENLNRFWIKRLKEECEVYRGLYQI